MSKMVLFYGFVVQVLFWTLEMVSAILSPSMKAMLFPMLSCVLTLLVATSLMP